LNVSAKKACLMITAETADSLAPSDDELARLEGLLMRLDERGFMLSDADGFLAAMALCPTPPVNDDWAAVLFEAHDSTPSQSELAEMIDVAARRLAEIRATALAAPPAFQPLLEYDDDGFPLAEIWAEGFLIGMGERMEAWQPLLDHPAGALALTPLLALGDPNALAAMHQKKGRRARERDRLALGMADSVARLARLTRVLQEGGDLSDLPDPSVLEASALSPQPRQVERIGRNDPCRCGSGQKYKKCCGAA
jgi:uncharacterized protein